MTFQWHKLDRSLKEVKKQKRFEIDVGKYAKYTDYLVFRHCLEEEQIRSSTVMLITLGY